MDVDTSRGTGPVRAAHHTNEVMGIRDSRYGRGGSIRYLLSLSSLWLGDSDGNNPKKSLPFIVNRAYNTLECLLLPRKGERAAEGMAESLGG